jgi:hypothetical protein
MLGSVFNIFRIPDLRNKIFFTVALLIIYRIGFHITVPGFDQSAIASAVATRDTDSPLGRAAEYMQIFTGGTLSRSSLFGLGIMPYITASIILNTGIHALSDGADMHYSVNDVYEGYGNVYLCRDAHPGCGTWDHWYDGRDGIFDVAGRTDR